MELGGNAPFIVFDDADLVNAIDLAVAIKYGNSGQICVAANRFFIHENIYDEFVKVWGQSRPFKSSGWPQGRRPPPRGGGSRPWANTMEFQEMFVLKTSYFEEFGVNLGHLKAQVDPRGGGSRPWANTMVTR